MNLTPQLLFPQKQVMAAIGGISMHKSMPRCRCCSYSTITVSLQYIQVPAPYDSRPLPPSLKRALPPHVSPLLSASRQRTSVR